MYITISKSLIPKINKQFCTSSITHSGHSKWSKIKHDKAINDKNKGKLQSRMSIRITSLAKSGGIDPANNIALASAIEQATKASVPRKIIETALEKASNNNKTGGPGVETVTYEAMTNNGIGLIIEGVTDNKNRSIASVKHLIHKYGASLSPSLFLFIRKGLIKLYNDEKSKEFKKKLDFDIVFEDAAELGAQDIEINEDSKDLEIDVWTLPNDVSKVTNGLKSLGYSIKESSIVYVENDDTAVQLDPESPEGEKLQKMVSEIEDLSDISCVYTNVV